MQQVIIAIHLMVVTALVILVLYQKSEGGALGMGGGDWQPSTVRISGGGASNQDRMHQR